MTTLGQVGKGLAQAAAAMLLAACGGVPHHVDSAPASVAEPEPDPACRREVQRTLASSGLDQVTVRVALAPDGRALRLDLLGPALSTADAAEVRRAFVDCAWKPPESGLRTATITIRR